MMTEEKKDSFQKCVRGLLDLVLDSTGHDLVYQELSWRDPLIKKVKFEDFCAAYVSYKLALGCLYWVSACENHRIADKEIRNLFFRGVMNQFETPKTLGEATRFSETLYAANADKEQSPILGALAHLFHRLGLSALSGNNEDDHAVSTAFSFMMEVSDALKIVFEDKFDMFIYTHKDFRAEQSS